MAQFRTINYSRQLYESLRNYFAVNAEGQVSMLYKILLCYLQVLQPYFDTYDTFRRKEYLIAQCKWQIGQLTNVLNMIYDSALLRIYITQSAPQNLQATGFAYAAKIQARGFGVPAQVQGRGFYDASNRSTVAINVPVATDLVDLTATIEQIRPDGILYVINTF